MTHNRLQWESAPFDYKIDKNMVHVWRACFHPSRVSDGKFLSNLSEEEIERAQRYIRGSDRDRYIFAHILLRMILSAYVGCAPRQLVFKSKEYQKPILGGSRLGSEIQFNLSHSKDVTLIAISRGHAIGIDIEYMRKVPEVDQIVKCNFSAKEQKFFDSLPPADFEKGFFAYWTSKEAYLKGIGKGLSYPLENFSILFSNLETDGFIDVQDNFDHDCCWKIIRLSPWTGYSGALAVEKQISGLRYFDYY